VRRAREAEGGEVSIALANFDMFIAAYRYTYNESPRVIAISIADYARLRAEVRAATPLTSPLTCKFVWKPVSRAWPVVGRYRGIDVRVEGTVTL
jgi:hypothetical protein